MSDITEAPAARVPEIYVACLAAYNNGRLHGEHIKLDGIDADELWARVKHVLDTSPVPMAEEWAIHDHSYLGSWVGEYTDLNVLALLSQCWAEIDDAERADAFIYWFGRVVYEDRIPDLVKFYGDDPSGLVDKFDEEFRGNHESFKAYVLDTELVEMVTGITTVKTLVYAFLESNRYGLTRDAREHYEELADDLMKWFDWDQVAEYVEESGEVGSFDTHRPGEPWYGMWIFENQE